MRVTSTLALFLTAAPAAAINLNPLDDIIIQIKTDKDKSVKVVKGIKGVPNVPHQIKVRTK